MSMLLETMLNEVESELKKQVSRLDNPRTSIYHEMLTYHMGWTGEGAGSEATGKRIRPLLLLLINAAASQPDSQDWKKALPAAAAVELIHNFSLVHDDIQDNSDKRRGRPTVWKNWGKEQAINAGDGLFVISNLSAADLIESYPAEKVVRAIQILQNTCLDLTRGQYLDMSYENRIDLTIEDYWPMISGKTAALLSCCCELGALLGGADENTITAYRSFGHYLGLAFQAYDDLLGIWGDEAITGKSISGDLVERKKTLPVLFGLERKGEFARQWLEGANSPGNIEEMAKLLASEGAYTYTHDLAVQLTDLATNSLREANPQGQAAEILSKLADQLIRRQS